MDKIIFCEGRYEVFQEIRGHNNNIYLAFDKEDQRAVAIKPMKNRDNASLSKIEQETQIWVDINFTPYIVTLLSVEKINEAPALVMEWVSNGYGEKNDLKTWAEQHKQYLFNEVLKFALQFCFAMTKCIQKHPGFIHRDIKPENILVDSGDNLKICDISISNGTEGYVAPEIKEGNSFSELTDIYSFGKTFISLFNERLLGDVAYIHEAKAIIGKCCNKNPTLRCSTFQDIYVQLQSICYRCQGEYFSPQAEVTQTMEHAIQKSLALAQLEYHQQALDTLIEATRHIIIDGYQIKTLYHSPSVVFNIANAHYNLEQYKPALEYIEMALDLAQDEYRLWDLKAHILYFDKEGNHPLEEVMACIERALQLCPEDITVYQLKSRILLDTGRFEDSIRVLNEILHIEPRNKEATRRMAINYRYLGIWDKTIAWYNKFLLINPDDRKTIIKDIVACHIENNNLEAAQNTLTPLYKENPNDYSVSWLQADIWFRSGNREDAYIELYKDKILLETEIAFNDRNDTALEILSMVCSLLFDFPAARKYIEKACFVKNTTVRSGKRVEMYNMCKFADEIDRIFVDCHRCIKENATEEFDEILSFLEENIRYAGIHDSDSLTIQYLLMNSYFYSTCIYFQRKQYQKALSAIEKAQKIFPIQPFYVVNKAKLLYLNNRYKEALSCIEYGNRADSCMSCYNDLEQLKQQIIYEHPELNE